MLRGGATVRHTAGLALVLALAAALTPFAGTPALAQENGEASVTIYTAVCPPGYDPDRLFEDCYDNPGAGVDYVLVDPNLETLVATSGPAGLAAFEGLVVAGSHDLQVQYPLNLITVRCSEDGTPFAFAYTEVVNQIRLGLTTDNDIRCDVYVPAQEPSQPETGTLTIYKATCPPGYADDEYFRDCFANATAGVVFAAAIAGGHGVPTRYEATTDANGFASFELPPGPYAVEEDVPGEFADSFVYCSAGGQRVETGVSADRSRFVVTVRAGVDVRCDYYNLPFDLRGETPTAAPTVAAARATATVVTLPSTGAGDESGAGGAAWPPAAALALVGLAGLGLAANRTRLDRGGTRVGR